MSEKVLLIDDEKDFLDIMSQRMENRGMSVTTATSGVDALELVKGKNFDAIVVDLQMPGMNGIEALKEFKQINPDIQVILLTGNATLEKGIEAMKEGAMDLVEKPANLDDLREKIQKAKAQKMILVEKKTQEKMQEIMQTKGW